ncbi:MAG TPA: ABC transporter [Treponema sp.]|nr:ABC transporter [Treponema sp.]HBB42670.1 ABC transporter [Treponema sp.]
MSEAAYTSSAEKSAKTKSVWTIILRRELAAYFTSPVAYIVGFLFLIYCGFRFFSIFFLMQRAELRNFFSQLPLVFSFFVPAMTMRVFAEEKRSGSIETLLTLPVTVLDVAIGKSLAAFISAVSLLVPTLFYVVACCIFGTPDAGPIIGGYAGAVLLAAAFTSIGVFSSALTKNQIIAFFVALAICISLTMIDYFAILFPGPVVSLVTFISASNHFDSISRGIIDTRDLLYFISVTALFFVLTVHTLNKSRKG